MANVVATSASPSIEKLPTTIKDLVPDFLDAAPLDPFDGKPLRYIQDKPGYSLYSVGKDRIDDGGNTNGRSHYGFFPDITFKILR